MSIVYTQSADEIKAGDYLFSDPRSAVQAIKVVRRIDNEHIRVYLFEGKRGSYNGGSKYPECTGKRGPYTLSYTYDIKNRYGRWIAYSPHPATNIFKSPESAKPTPTKKKKKKATAKKKKPIGIGVNDGQDPLDAYDPYPF